MDGIFYSTHNHHTHKAAAMHLILHSKNTVRVIRKPKLMRSFYQQLSRGHVFIDFIK